MRILVTGGLGFIRSRVVIAALQGLHEVRILDRTPALPSDSPVEVVEADMTDPAAVDSALDGIDVVCHQAAKVGLGVDLQDMPDYVLDKAVRSLPEHRSCDCALSVDGMTADYLP